MEENVTQPIVPETKIKFVLLTVIVILMVSLMAVGFLAYQNYQLQKKISQVGTIPSVLPTTAPTIVPTSGSDPTANWKTHTNQQFKYEFKYPSTGSVIGIKPRDELFIGGDGFYLNYNDDKFRPQQSEVYVHVYNGRNQKLETWLQENSTGQPFGSSIEKEFYGYLEFGRSNLLGMSAVKFRHEVMGFISHNVAVEKNGLIFIIGNIEVADDLSSEYNQILSTFKFVN